jgi:hypothetical protein
MKSKSQREGKIKINTTLNLTHGKQDLFIGKHKKAFVYCLKW